MKRFLCFLFGHKWYFYLVSGSNGEPAEDKCLRCGVTIEVSGYCRCLNDCDCPTVIERGHHIQMNMPRRFVWQEERS